MNDRTVSENIMELCDCRIRSFAIELVRQLMVPAEIEITKNELVQAILSTTEKFGGFNVTQGRDRIVEPNIKIEDSKRDESSFESDLKSLGINPVEDEKAEDKRRWNTE